MCIACTLGAHEMCRAGKEDCRCPCQNEPKKRVFSAEQERVMEEAREECNEEK